MTSLPLSAHWKQYLHTLTHPPKYLKASIVVALGGLLNGLDSGLIGPVTTMPHFTSSFGHLSPSLHGLVISSILLSGTFASFLAGPFSDRVGRTRSIAIGSLVFSVGAALEAGAATLGMFIAARGLAGFGEGIFLSTLVVYVCEISPPKYRGPLATTVQLFITAGLCTGYFTCYGTVTIDSSLSWRFPLAMQAAISAFLSLAAFFYLPESPRWLSSKGRHAESTAAWDDLGVSAAEREKESLVVGPVDGVLDAQEGPSRPNPGGPVPKQTTLTQKVQARFAAMTPVLKAGPRKPMLMGVFVMAMQQLSGIDGVIYYAPLIFQQAGLSSTSASFLASGVSAILIFIFTILSVYLSTHWGRRTSTLYGGTLVCACMLLMGLLYGTNSVHAHRGIARWLVILTIYVFSIAYSMTWAFGVKIFASEIQPAATRATATSIAQAANFMTNFFVAFITPVLLASSSSGAYWLFGGCTLLTTVVCFLYMPETKGRDLETVVTAFGEHKAADVPLIRGLRGLGSRIGDATGLRRRAAPGIVTSRAGQVELERLG